MAGSPIGTVTGGTLSTASNSLPGNGAVVVDTGQNVWLPWGQASSYTGCGIGIVVTAAAVTGGNMQVQTLGQIPWQLFNLGSGNAGVVAAGGMPVRAGLGSGTLIGTCDPSGTITLVPSYVGGTPALVGSVSVSGSPSKEGQVLIYTGAGGGLVYGLVGQLVLQDTLANRPAATGSGNVFVRSDSPYGASYDDPGSVAWVSF